MNRSLHLGLIVILVLACSLPGSPQDKGNWRAASSTATAITGDIAISDTKIAINFSGFTIAQIRRLEPAETSAAFDSDNSAGRSGILYRLNVPASKRFLHHNTLCGNEDTQWMATYVAGRDLRVAFFSGSSAPVFTIEALANSSDLCGTFSYVR